AKEWHTSMRRFAAARRPVHPMHGCTAIPDGTLRMPAMGIAPGTTAVSNALPGSFVGANPASPPWVGSHSSTYTLELFMRERQLNVSRFARWAVLIVLLVAATPAAGQTFPDHLDWREQGKVTPVKKQGPCGSCWLFATISAFESSFAIRTGELVEMDVHAFPYHF